MITTLHQEKDKLSPSEFMRARRPTLYSDSVFKDKKIFDQSTFEYHLDTLTSRNEERAFETFCRRLAEREICPNLRPQTGPTGGGDSKVDTETYPVSDEISERWFEGIGREASKELWGFAFSAKKDWLAKVKKDIASIASTNRGHKHVYFISNQYISDKKRDELEQKLTDLYKFKVHIFDKNWIVTRIYEKNLLDIAIETLNLSVSSKELLIKGPNDIARENEFRNLQNKIADPTKYDNKEDLINDCLQVALIARGLEKARSEVDGLFYRAERLAEYYKQRLLIKIIYSHAWTAFWWYEDFHFVSNHYEKLENIISNTGTSWDYELLLNLWTCLNTAVSRGLLTQEEAKLDIREEKLRKELQSILGCEQNSHTLWAQTQLSIMDLHQAVKDQSKLPGIFRELLQIIITAERYLEYPLQSLVLVIRGLNDVLNDSPEFDCLMEKV